MSPPGSGTGAEDPRPGLSAGSYVAGPTLLHFILIHNLCAHDGLSPSPSTLILFQRGGEGSSRLFYPSSDGRKSSGDSPPCASFVWTGKAPHCNFGATEDAGYGAQSPELGSPALLSPAPPVISGKGLLSLFSVPSGLLASSNVPRF